MIIHECDRSFVSKFGSTLVCGPRCSGKTTFCCSLKPQIAHGVHVSEEKLYIDSGTSPLYIFNHLEALNILLKTMKKLAKHHIKHRIIIELNPASLDDPDILELIQNARHLSIHLAISLSLPLKESEYFQPVVDFIQKTFDWFDRIVLMPDITPEWLKIFELLHMSSLASIYRPITSQRDNACVLFPESEQSIQYIKIK